MKLNLGGKKLFDADAKSTSFIFSDHFEQKNCNL